MRAVRRSGHFAAQLRRARRPHHHAPPGRKPDWIRFGLQALALSHEDLWVAVSRLRKVLESELWRDPKFAKVSV
jgi:hypothetical protein